MSGETFDLTQWAIGVADCLVAFGLCFVEAGIFTREQLAAAFTECAKQGAAAAEEAGEDPASRTAAAQAIATFFAMPLVGDRSGFRVIGGDGDGS